MILIKGKNMLLSKSTNKNTKKVGKKMTQTTATTTVKYWDIDELTNLVKEGKVKYLNNDFYIRTSQPDYEKKLKELVATDEKGNPCIKVFDPIKVRVLEDGVIEVIDGNTRLRTIIQSNNDSRDINTIYGIDKKSKILINDIPVYDIPYIEEDVSDDELLIYQIKSNDTQEPHTIYDKAVATVRLYEQNIQKHGKTKASGITQREVNLSASSMTHYIKAVEISEKSDIVADMLKEGLIKVRIFYDLISSVVDNIRQIELSDIEKIEDALQKLNNQRIDFGGDTITSKMVKEFTDLLKAKTIGYKEPPKGTTITDEDKSKFPQIINIEWLTENGYLNEELIPDVEQKSDDLGEIHLAESIKFQVDEAKKDNPDFILDVETLEKAVNMASLSSNGTTKKIIKDYTVDNFRETNEKLVNRLKGFTKFVNSGNLQPHHQTALVRSGITNTLTDRIKKRLLYSDTSELSKVLPQLINIIIAMSDDDIDITGDKLNQATPYFVEINESLLSKIDTILGAQPKQPKPKKEKSEEKVSDEENQTLMENL